MLLDILLYMFTGILLLSSVMVISVRNPVYSVLFLILSFKRNFYSNSAITNYYVNWLDKVDKFSDIEALGQLIFTQYVLQFLIAGNILLLATIAVVVLTINTNSKQKNQNIFKPISRTHKNVLLFT